MSGTHLIDDYVHPLSKVIGILQGISGTHPVEPQYYSCRQKSDVWVLCGKAEVMFADPPDEVVAQSSVVLIPLCMSCSASPSAWCTDGVCRKRSTAVAAGGSRRGRRRAKSARGRVAGRCRGASKK